MKWTHNLGIFIAIIAAIAFAVNMISAAPTLDEWSTPATTPYYDKDVNYIFNVSIDLDSGNSTNAAQFNFNGTNYTITSNCTGSGSDAYCVYVNTSTIEGNYTYYLWVDQDDGQAYQTPSRVYVYDDTDPSFSNEAVSENAGTSSDPDMSFTFTANFTDATPATCTVRVQSDNSDIALTSTTGTITEITAGSQYLCTATIDESLITEPGPFEIEIYGTDEAGNSATGTNLTNVTVVPVYGNSWNLIMTVENTTTYDMGALSGAITHVSVYSNENHNYTSYVVGSNTNNDTVIEEGDVAYIYVSGTTGTAEYMFIEWSKDGNDETTDLYKGWNHLGTMNQTGWTFKELCDKTLDNQTADDGQAIIYVTKYDAENQHYKSHRCGFTFGSYDNFTIDYGQAVWVKVNGTATGNYTRIDLEGGA